MENQTVENIRILKSFIEEQMKQGVPRDEVRKVLIDEGGWSREFLDKIFDSKELLEKVGDVKPIPSKSVVKPEDEEEKAPKKNTFERKPAKAEVTAPPAEPPIEKAGESIIKKSPDSNKLMNSSSYVVPAAIVVGVVVLMIVGGFAYIKLSSGTSNTVSKGAGGDEAAILINEESEENEIVYVKKEIEINLNIEKTLLSILPDGAELEPRGIYGFSPDGRTVAYAIREVDQIFASHLMINDKKYGPFRSIKSVYFSPDSSRTAFVTVDYENVNNLYLNGELLDSAGYSITRLLFSDDGNQLSYKAIEKNTEGLSWIQIVNNVRSRPFDNVGEIVFGANNTFAYIAEDGEKSIVVINGEEKFSFNKPVYEVTLSASGKDFAFTTTNLDDSVSAVLNGKKQAPYYDIVALTLSSDGNHLAYIAQSLDKNEPRFFVVLDGVEQNYYEDINSGALVFSDDSKHLAYIASDTEKNEYVSFVILDSVEGERYETVLYDSLMFNKKGELAYSAEFEDKSFVILDGVEIFESGLFENVGYIAFNPIDDSLTFLYSNARKKYLYSNDNFYGGHEFIFLDSVVFSPDGKHIAYDTESAFGQNGRFSNVILDGTGKESYDYITRIGFSKDSKYLTYGARKGNQFWWISELIDVAE